MTNTLESMSDQNKKIMWDAEKIKQGFERFFELHGHFPDALEIDRYEHLPSSRTIQRSFGGLAKFRESLGHNITHYGKGENRSRIAKNVNSRGALAEKELYGLLKAQFGEMFVHVEKPFSKSSKQRLDFFVYSPNGNFGIDIFSPKDRHSLIGSLAIKQISYKDYNEKLYFIVANNDIASEELKGIVANKKNLLVKNFILTNLEGLMSDIKNFKRYTAK